MYLFRDVFCSCFTLCTLRRRCWLALKSLPLGFAVTAAGEIIQLAACASPLRYERSSGSLDEEFPLRYGRMSLSLRNTSSSRSAARCRLPAHGVSPDGPLVKSFSAEELFPLVQLVSNETVFSCSSSPATPAFIPLLVPSPAIVQSGECFGCWSVLLFPILIPRASGNLSETSRPVENADYWSSAMDDDVFLC